jgi:hypothetical protein
MQDMVNSIKASLRATSFVTEKDGCVEINIDRYAWQVTPRIREIACTQGLRECGKEAS